MRTISIVALLCIGVLVFHQSIHRKALGQMGDDEAGAELIHVIREFERGINTRDVDLAMSVWSSQASIQARASWRKETYSWEAYKKRLADWVKIVKDFKHFNFREVKIQGNKATLMCDVRIMAYSRKLDRWKPRTVLDVYYEFVKEDGKWYLLKRTY